METEDAKGVDPKEEVDQPFLNGKAYTRNDEACGSEHKHILQRIRSDKVFRAKLITTVWMMWAYIYLGCRGGEFGPTFPDLQLIVNKDLKTSAWLLTLGTFGFTVGSLIAGILYDRFSALLLLSVFSFLAGVTNMVIPWCSMFPLMMVFRFLAGVMAAGIETGGNAEILRIWGTESRPYVQTLHFLYAVGAIISPLYAKTFLAPRIYEETVTESNNTNYMQNTTVVYGNNKGFISVTHVGGFTESGANSYKTSINVPFEKEGLIRYGETRVHYSFLISGLFGISASIPFIYLFIKYRRREKKRRATGSSSVESDVIESENKMSLTLKIIFLVLLGLSFALYAAVEFSFHAYLVTFCLLQLDWSKDTGSVATSSVWIAVMCGRLLGIVVTKFVKPSIMLLLSAILLALLFICLFAGIKSGIDALVWVAIPGGGLAMSTIFPTLYTWCNESIMPVSGKVSSVFLIGASAGATLNPLLLGSLMQEYSSLWYIYGLLLESGLLLFLLVVVIILAKLSVGKGRLKQKLNMEYTVDSVEQKQHLKTQELELTNRS